MPKRHCWTKRIRLIMKELRNSFFTLSIFITLSLLVYSWALHTLAQEESRLLSSCDRLSAKLSLVQKENDLFKEKLSNVKDPSCEEYMLRCYLGLCPRDALEVHF